MAGNRFGELFSFTTWGESHGPAIGCVVDGVPSKIPLTEQDIQIYLDQRRPGQNRFVTQRQEADKVTILSGVFEGQTTGTPISLLIENTNSRSKDYSDIAKAFRPGHADYTYQAKYGIRDYRGGGRSSARETAMRVAAGAIARKVLCHFLGPLVKIRGAVVQIGAQAINKDRWDWDIVSSNDFWCPDVEMIPVWTQQLTDIRKKGSSIGAIVEVHAQGIPAGLGAPVYDKLDADLAKALMSINAVKGVEIGDGFSTALLEGSQNADEIFMDNNKVSFSSNHAGGILGGISSGQDIVTRFAVKPTSSILTPRKSITQEGKNITIRTRGRHDPCVGIRAVPVGEGMVACTLADHLLRHRAFLQENK